MRINRRDFLATTMAGAGALLLPRPVLAAEPPIAYGDDPFQLVPLGRTGLRVSLIGSGTGMSGFNRQSNQTRLGQEKFEALLRYAFEKGVRLFDCADAYGTNPYVGRALKAYPRGEYVLTTKIWLHPGGYPDEDRAEVDVMVDRFRREFDTDYIDLVLLHCMMDGQWTTVFRKEMDLLEELKAKGIIRAHGVSIHSLPALRACVDSDWVDTVHVRLNAYGDRMDDPDPDVVAEVVRQLHDAGKGLIAMKLIGEGKYRDDAAKRDESIRFVLSQGAVSSMIVGFERPEEIDDFATRVGSALAEA